MRPTQLLNVILKCEVLILLRGADNVLRLFFLNLSLSRGGARSLMSASSSIGKLTVRGGRRRDTGFGGASQI